MPQLRSAVRMPRTGTSATPIMSEADFASKMKSVKELASDLENDFPPVSEDGRTSCAGQHKHNKSLIEELLSRSLDELDARSPGGRIATRISEDLPPDVLFQVSPSRHNFANVKFSLPSAGGGNANAAVGTSAAKRPGPSSASSSSLQQKTNHVSTKAYKAADMATIPENESSTTVDENYSASGTSASSKESGAMSPEEELYQYHFPAETAVSAGGTAARVRSKSQPQRFAREAGCPPAQVEQLQRALPRYDLEPIGQEFFCDEEDLALVHAGQSSQFASNLSTKSKSAAAVKLALAPSSMAASFRCSAVSCKRIDDNEPHALVVNQVADVPFRPVSMSLRSAAVTGKANIAKAIAPSKPPALQIPRAPKVPGATASSGTTTANPKKPPTTSFIKAVVIDDAVSGSPASQFFPEQKIVHLGRGKPSQQATDHGRQQSSPGFAHEIRASPKGASHASASSSGAGRAASVSSSAAAGGNGKRKKKKSLRKKGSSPVDMALAEEALLSAERFIRECRTGRMHHPMTHAASYSGGALRTLSAMNSAEEDRRFEQLYWQSAQKLGIPRSESAPRIGAHLADRSRQIAASSRPPPPIAFGSALPPPSSAPVRAASTKSRKLKSASRAAGAAAGTKKKKKKGSGKHSETTMTGLKRSQYNLAMLRRGMIMNTNDRLMASPGSVDGSVARISAAPSANDDPANMHFAPVEARHDAGLVSSKSVPAFQPNSRRTTSKPQPQQFGGVTLNTSKETVCSTRAGTSRTASKDFSSDDANLAKAAASPDSSSSTGGGGMLKQRGVPAKRNLLTATTTGPASISPKTLSAPQQSKSFQPAPRGKTALRVVMPSTGTPAKSSHAPQEPKNDNEPVTEETIFFGDHEYRRVRRPADAIRSTRKPLFDSGLAVAPPPRRSKSLGQFSSYGPTSASSVTASLYQTGTLPRPAANVRRDLQRSHAKVTTTTTTSTSTANKKRSTAAAERENVFSYAGPHRMEILELDRRRERMRDIILAPRTVADAVDHQEPNLRRGSGAGSSASASRTRPGRKASVSDDGIVDESPTTASATAEVMYEVKKPDYRRSASAGTLRSGAQHRLERRQQGSPRSRLGKPASPPPGEQTHGFSSGRSGTRSKLRIVSPRERSASPERGAAFIEEMRQEKQRLQRSDHKNITSLQEMEKMVDETHDLLLKRGMLNKKGSSARASSGQIPQRAEKRPAADSESDSEFDADAGRKRGATSLTLLSARKPAHDVRRKAARALGPDIEFLWEYDAEDDLPLARSASAGSSSSTARGIAPPPARRQNSSRGRSRGSSKDVDHVDEDEDRKMELVSELDFSFEDLASLEKQETTCLEDIDRAIEELQKQLETIDQD
mmetsp:Transcript_23018/g.58159  ORF Transcript_23018/g.58159 Transcript_23018/m.58159 type:complete len:1357 (-) Transcript_23018:604-4674(-)